MQTFTYIHLLYYTLQISNWWLRDFHTDINTTSLSKKKRKSGCQLDPMKVKLSSSAAVSRPPAALVEKYCLNSYCEQ